MGKCPQCDGDLVMKRGKYGQFLACSNYPECKTTFSLPNNVGVKATDKTCKECGLPIITLIKKGKKPQTVCINLDCPSKKVDVKKTQKKCPKCSSELVIRKSVYGKFLGCTNYPKCKYTEKLENNSKDN